MFPSDSPFKGANEDMQKFLEGWDEHEVDHEVTHEKTSNAEQAIFFLREAQIALDQKDFETTDYYLSLAMDELGRG